MLPADSAPSMSHTAPLKTTTNNGLLINAKGSVTLTSVFASLNSFSGVYVDNCQWNGLACAGTGIVTVTSLAAKGEEFCQRLPE